MLWQRLRLCNGPPNTAAPVGIQAGLKLRPENNRRATRVLWTRPPQAPSGLQHPPHRKTSAHVHCPRLAATMDPGGLSAPALARAHSHHSHHSHDHSDNVYLTSRNKNDAGVKVTRIGLYVNLGMAIGKGVGGYVFHSQGPDAAPETLGELLLTARSSLCGRHPQPDRSRQRLYDVGHRVIGPQTPNREIPFWLRQSRELGFAGSQWDTARWGPTDGLVINDGSVPRIPARNGPNHGVFGHFRPFAWA